MIDNPNPIEWRELQNGVCRLLNDIGLVAKTEVSINTPRGDVEVDVYAVDENSVDKIQYIVECKNWAGPIPQHVVHSFTTVMHETGGNIGFIISKVGLQSGAVKYIKNTNIYAMTYHELQNRYMDLWWRKYFLKKVHEAVKYVHEYVEPINSYRARLLDKLDNSDVENYHELNKRYGSFGLLMSFMSSREMKLLDVNVGLPCSIEFFKFNLKKLGGEFDFKSIYYRDLLLEITNKLSDIECEFNAVFGGNIFICR